MSESSVVRYESRDDFDIIILNRPDKYNAITMELLEELIGAFDKAKNSNNRVVILTGAGKGFCAGADLQGFGTQPTPRDVRDSLTMYYGNVVRRIVEMEKPVIAAINGPVAGAGVGFALACDYRVMADHATLRYAFINIALIPDAGSTWFLVRTVGYAKALEIAIDGDKLSATYCKEIGLVNKVVPAVALMDITFDLANYLKEKAPLAFAGTKSCMNYSMQHGLFDSIAHEAHQQMVPFASNDMQEGVMAFMQKRKPIFKGE